MDGYESLSLSHPSSYDKEGEEEDDDKAVPFLKRRKRLVVHVLFVCST